MTAAIPRRAAIGYLGLSLAAPLLLADEPAQRSAQPWPSETVLTIGDIRTRIDGPKLWTLSGIDYRGERMATQDSAYGSVLTIRHVGHLGTAHFLDVPGKPGLIEKEEVTDLRFFLDEKPVKISTAPLQLAGQSFRMERRSTIRAMQLQSTVTIQGNLLSETIQYQATDAIDLQNSYPWMYAMTPEGTDFAWGNEKGLLQTKACIPEGNTVAQVVQGASWVAVYNRKTGKGSVCCFLQHPANTSAEFLLVDAPGSYRKVAAYTLVDTVVKKGFAGTYQSGVGFFLADESTWKTAAPKRAEQIRQAFQA